MAKSAIEKRREKKAKDRQELIDSLDSKYYPLQKGWDGGIPWCLPTGLPSLDIISARDNHGVYGVPGGSMITFLGEPKQGKSTLGLTMLANAQKEDPFNRRPPMLCHFLETEGGLLSRDYIQRQGVDLENMFYDTPDTLEQAFDSIRTKLQIIDSKPIEKQIPMFILLDSISNLQTNAEEEMTTATYSEHASAAQKKKRGGKMGHARVNSERIRQLTPLIRRTKSIIVIVAQAKADIQFSGYSRQERKTFIGNRPILFLSALLVEVRRGASIKDADDNHTGMVVNMFVAMSKVGIPYGKAQNLELDYYKGFDEPTSLHDALLARNLIYKGKGRNANQFRFALGFEGRDDIVWKEREGIKELPAGDILAMKNALYLDEKDIASSRLPE